jgi:hypothetical protein
LPIQILTGSRDFWLFGVLRVRAVLRLLDVTVKCHCKSRLDFDLLPGSTSRLILGRPASFFCINAGIFPASVRPHFKG